MNNMENNATDTVNRIRGALGNHILNFEKKSDRRIYIDIAPETVLEASSVMIEEIGARLQIATGIDTPAGIEVMYHWALDTEDCVITIRVTVPHADPSIDSIATMCPAAEWIEREMWELLGVEFRGHPDLRHLLLDESWPEGNYPLRKNKRGHGPLPRKGQTTGKDVGADLSAIEKGGQND
jgi:Ni,Fe-hydrogenase III component G